MGLFDFRKKGKEQEQKVDAATDAEAVTDTDGAGEPYVSADRWTLADKAAPQGHQNADGSPFIMFAMREETDTVLPIDPRKMYPVNGKKIRDFRLVLVNASDEVIGALPYYFCWETLADNIVENRPPFTLVRGMTAEEMDDLIEAVQTEVTDRERMQGIFADNLDFLSLDEISAETVEKAFDPELAEIFTISDVKFDSGVVIAADPLTALQDEESFGYLRETIPAGKYPVSLSILHPEQDDIRIAAMKLKVREEQAVSYTMAEDYRIIDDEEEDGLGGISIETGLLTFCDQEVLEDYWTFTDEWYEGNPDGDIYEDYFSDLFAESHKEHPESQREEGDFIRFRIPGSEQEMVIASSGFGDGYYSAFWGYDEQGEIVELVTVFIDPALYERM